MIVTCVFMYFFQLKIGNKLTTNKTKKNELYFGASQERYYAKKKEN